MYADNLAGKVGNKQTPPERYLSEMKAAIRTAMAERRDLLGPEAFPAIFGDAKKKVSGIIDRETVLSQDHR